jgi:hypothetical protein
MHAEQRGEQGYRPIAGNRTKRIVDGVINFFMTGAIVPLEERGTPHTAEDSLACASELGIQVRLLRRAYPELNVREHLF